MELNAKLGQRGTFTPSKRSDAQHIILECPNALYQGTFELQSIVGGNGVASCGCLFGLSSPLLSCVGVSMTRRGGSRCELTFLEEGQDINLTQRYRYMYTTLDERARALEKGLVWLEKEMVERADLEGMALTPVGVPRQEPVLVCGRVRLPHREACMDHAELC
jgi:hypothetical protein